MALSALPVNIHQGTFTSERLPVNPHQSAFPSEHSPVNIHYFGIIVKSMTWNGNQLAGSLPRIVGHDCSQFVLPGLKLVFDVHCRS
jgi:hypothetical protein